MNLGIRGDILQTGKGGDLQQQAQNGVDALKNAKIVADNSLGRPSTNAEQYIVYQQGSGGGPALIKAAENNPDARAVDVLSPLYKNPKTALQAVVNNGGNASMSCKDFVNFITQKYAANANRAVCQFPGQTVTPAPLGEPPPGLQDRCLRDLRGKQ